MEIFNLLVKVVRIQSSRFLGRHFSLNVTILHADVYIVHFDQPPWIWIFPPVAISTSPPSPSQLFCIIYKPVYL